MESRRVRDTPADKRLGLKYGPGDGDKVDLFGEEGREPVIMLYISGGYWQELSAGDISTHTVQPLVTAAWSQGSVCQCVIMMFVLTMLFRPPRRHDGNLGLGNEA